jgi:hypothetical protein
VRHGVRSGHGGWRHGGWRYLVVAAVLPLVVMGAIPAALTLTDRSDGLDGDPGEWTAVVSMVVVIGGWVVTAIAVVGAVTHRFPLERPRYGRLPLALAGASLSGAVAANVAIVDLGLLIAIVAFWSALGGIAGWYAAAAMLGPAGLPTSDAPAPRDAARHHLDAGATAVWIGQVPPSPVLTWLGPVLVPAAVAWVLAPEVVSWAFMATWSAIWIGSYALSRRRMRVVIGRSGMRILGGAHRWERRAIPLEHIVSASCTTLNRWWWANPWRHRGTHRLTIATRSGPAMLVELTDGSEVVVSLSDPSDAVGVLNSLLDNRAAAMGIERS